MIAKTCWSFPTYCCSPHQLPVLNIHEPKALVGRHASISSIGLIRIARRLDGLRGQHNCYRVIDVEEVEDFLLRGLSDHSLM
jgi:hypothetical protein